MTDTQIFPVPEGFAARAHVDAATYDRLYRQSLDDTEGFWRDQATFLDWMRPFTQVRDASFDPADVHVRWFADGTLNASVNCIDRHLPAKADVPAVLWEGDRPGESRVLSWGEMAD